MTHLTWRKSSRCGNTTCVEVASTEDAVWIRDSKDLSRPALAFNHDAWADFLDGVIAGDFSLD